MVNAQASPTAERPDWMAGPVSGLPERAGWILFATMLSLLFTGYIPWFNNNIYHLPILRGDYDAPQFAGDAFVQSLRHFSSGFWMVFAGSAVWVTPKVFLFTAFVLSRALMMAAALSLAARFATLSRAFTLPFLILIAASPLMRGYAPGGGGLDIEYFSHSELANAVLLFSLSAAVARRYGLSVFLACLTFFLNAFMAVWLAPLWLGVVLADLRAGDIRPARVALQSVIGGVLGLPLVGIVLRGILGSGEIGKAADYSYAAYLRGFFPFHFFLDTLPRQDLMLLAMLIALVPLVALLLPARRGPYLAMGVAAILLLAVGSLVPVFTESRLILNLHFIRSAVLIQLLAVLGLSMVAAHWMSRPAALHDRTLGLLLFALLIAGKPALPAILLLLLYRALIMHRVRLSLLDMPLAHRFAGAIAMATLIATVPLVLMPLRQEMANQWRLAGQWEQAGEWARHLTPPGAIFLLPVAAETLPAGADPVSRGLDYDVSGFVATSARSVWTNYKFGATPMWSPDTFHLWRQRYDEVLALKTLDQRLAYAAAHRISYVGTFCDAASTHIPSYTDRDLCFYRVPAKP